MKLYNHGMESQLEKNHSGVAGAQPWGARREESRRNSAREAGVLVAAAWFTEPSARPLCHGDRCATREPLLSKNVL